MSTEQVHLGGFDEAIEALVKPVADALSSAIFYEAPAFGMGIPLIVVWLILGAVIATIYLRFINVRGFAHGFRILRGDYRTAGSEGLSPCGNRSSIPWWSAPCPSAVWSISPTGCCF